MGPILLRPYQQRAVAQLREHAGDRPILCAPCGAGKTTIAADIIQRAVTRGRSVLFLVHRTELLDQAVGRLAQFGIVAGAIKAGRPRTESPVQVASVQTLVRRKPWPQADLLIVDECQHATSATWRTVLDGYRDATTIGLSATPCRLDGRGLGSAGFGCILQDITLRSLIDEGYLVEPRVFAPPGPDMSGARVRHGDYAAQDAAERMSGLTGDIIEHWRKHAAGGRTVAFAVNVEHSESIASRFRAAGIASAHLDGTTPADLRSALLTQLRDGELTVLSNCQVLTEGWDLPSLSCAIVARPTRSWALHVQMVGRVLRACPDKAGAVVLDHAGNTNRLGLVTDPVVYSLEDRLKHAAPTGAAPVRTCLECYAVVSAACLVCPECGAPLPRVEPQGTGETDGELVEVKVVRDREVVYRTLVLEASSKGHRIGWARHAFRAEFGTWPRGLKNVESLYVCPEHEFETKQVTPWKTVTRCVLCNREPASV